MKSTQKKLKAKHFRYLSREYVKDPDLFLKEIVHEWGTNWESNFNYLINSSYYPPMKTDLAFEYGFTLIQLGQMIEVGYVILKKCNIQPYEEQDIFQYTTNTKVKRERGFPEEILCAFFGFKTLHQWHLVLNDLLQYRDYTCSNMDWIVLDLDYIPIRELLTKLPLALQEIYNLGGLHYCLPAKAN